MRTTPESEEADFLALRRMEERMDEEDGMDAKNAETFEHMVPPGSSAATSATSAREFGAGVGEERLLEWRCARGGGSQQPRTSRLEFI